MIYLGLDSGTQSTKCIALDLENGQVLAASSQTYGTLLGLPVGHLEQNPDTWVEASDATVRAVLAQLGDRRREVRAIGVSGQQHGLVVLNDDNQPIRPAKLWCDTSTTAQCDQVNKEFGGADEIIALTGNAMLPGYTAPKILWLKQNEPANFRATKSILLPHDYLNFWLTGEKRMEYGDASGTAMFDVRTRDVVRAAAPISSIPISSDLLPPVESSRKPVGLLRESLRAGWNLGPNVLVSAGGGDNMMGAIGTGNVAPGGVLTASLGTSGTLYAYSDEPVVDKGGETGRVLRQHRRLAAAGLHDERDRRHRTGAGDVWLGPCEDGGRRRRDHARRKRTPVFAVPQRRTHAEPAAWLGRHARAQHAQHGPGAFRAGGDGRRDAGAGVRAGAVP